MKEIKRAEKEMIKKIKAIYKKQLKERYKAKLRVFRECFDKIPFWEKQVVLPTADRTLYEYNDYDLPWTSYGKGVRIFYRKYGEWISFDTNYECIEYWGFPEPSVSKKETCNKTFYEQLRNLIDDKEIDEDTWIKLETIDWKDDESNDRGEIYELKVKEILPFKK